MDLLKNLILIVTAVIFVFYSFKNIKKGIIAYLVIYAISGLMGFARAMFYEPILLPLFIFIAGYKSHHRYSVIPILLSVLAIFNTYRYNGTFLDSTDSIVLAGLVLVAFRKTIFDGSACDYNYVPYVWGYTQAKLINNIASVGTSAFSIADSSDASSRMLTSTSVYGELISVDPNYIAFLAGSAAWLTYIIINERSLLSQQLGFKYLNKTIAKYILFIIFIVDVFFVIRGLSRGIILAGVFSILSYLAMKRHDSKTLISFSAIALFILLFAEHIPVLGAIISRFGENNDGGGRYLIWADIFSIIGTDQLSMIFGHGFGFPWWQNSSVAGGEMLGTHNSWISLILVIGIVGVIYLFSLILKSVLVVLKNKTQLNAYKLSLLAFVFTGCFSIEPLQMFWTWFVLIFGISITSIDEYERKN